MGLPMKEAELKGAVIELAHLYGWLVHHDRPSQNSRGQWMTAIEGDAGFPDLALARSGFVIFAELKSEKGRLTEGQQRWIEALANTKGVDARHLVFVWRPQHLTDGTIANILKETK